MFSKNLKYYRLKKNLTRRELASLSGITPMAITHYENGERNPTMDIIKKLAEVLEIRVIDFLMIRNANLVFKHAEFRKSRDLTLLEQEYIRESVEEYFSRFFTTVEILGGEVLPECPQCHCLKLTLDDEMNAIKLREHLRFAVNGPIGNLIETLENIGILVYMVDIDNPSFSGMNGFVDERPYIAINKAMSDERIRSTIAHELAHLMFDWSDYADKDEQSIESTVTAIAGAFLFSSNDAKRELGIHRKSITKDMLLVCREYGISMMLLVKRAKIIGIINQSAEKEFYSKVSQAGWKKNEPSRIKCPETPMLFEQLVYRAVSEEEISIQKGAELLKVSYADIEEHCCFNGGVMDAVNQQ
ncbi:MAG: ImmA/IrrE family metallo-endopeptidase [Erysipelotrichaceae bacterium]|nr:ImmA/IrrE family metallo-endopeptidase [Erysipelotrichaceae bacterium]